MVDQASIESVRKRIISTCQGRDVENYLVHAKRYAVSLSWLPPGNGLVVDLGSGAGLFTEMVRERHSYKFETSNFAFDLEKDPAPYRDASVDGVILMEVLEHFAVDPMFAMCEINRITKPGGFLFLTTPNIASWRSIHAILRHESPYLFGIFTRDRSTNRHNREYSSVEVRQLVTSSGYSVDRLEAMNVYERSEDFPPLDGLPGSDRGDTTFCLARKDGPVRDRYPRWLYW